MDAESEWQQLGDVPFRKFECYTLDWDVTIEDHIVVGAPNGGPVAVVRDDRKMVRALRDPFTMLAGANVNHLNPCM
jgi:hypothetical protein